MTQSHFAIVLFPQIVKRQIPNLHRAVYQYPDTFRSHTRSHVRSHQREAQIDRYLTASDCTYVTCSIYMCGQVTSRGRKGLGRVK